MYGRGLLAVPLPIRRARPSLSSQSFDPVSDQRGLICDLPRAVAAPAGQEQQDEQDDEDQAADSHQGVGDHPQKRLLQWPSGAVRRHVRC